MVLLFWCESQCCLKQDCQIPAPSPTPDCKIEADEVLEITGRWRVERYSNGDQGFIYSEGTVFDDSRTVTEDWSRSVTTSIEVGLEFGGASVEGTFAEGGSESVSQSIQKSRSETQTTNFDRSGMVWQFQYNVTDSCGSAKIDVKGLVITIGQHEPPCCLPGWAVDPRRAARSMCGRFSLLLRA